MSPFLAGFAQEVAATMIKTSAAYTIPERGVASLGRNLLGLAEKKSVRRALKHGAALGAIQGGVSGLLSGDSGHHGKNAVKGIIGGAAAGALGGAAFPHWFA